MNKFRCPQCGFIGDANEYKLNNFHCPNCNELVMFEETSTELDRKAYKNEQEFKSATKTHNGEARMYSLFGINRTIIDWPKLLSITLSFVAVSLSNFIYSFIIYPDYLTNYSWIVSSIFSTLAFFAIVVVVLRVSKKQKLSTRALLVGAANSIFGLIFNFLMGNSYFSVIIVDFVYGLLFIFSLEYFLRKIESTYLAFALVYIFIRLATSGIWMAINLSMFSSSGIVNLTSQLASAGINAAIFIAVLRIMHSAFKINIDKVADLSLEEISSKEIIYKGKSIFKQLNEKLNPIEYINKKRYNEWLISGLILFVISLAWYIIAKFVGQNTFYPLVFIVVGITGVLIGLFGKSGDRKSHKDKYD